jgi:ABC-type multidrug transport system fused ATPase/permease subunit
VVLAPSYLLIIFYYKKLTMADVAVALYLGTTLSRIINDLLIQYSRVESAMIAVERCHHFEKIEPEPQYKSYKKDFELVDGSKSSIEKLKKQQIKNTEQIVTEGSIEFRDMSCKYATSQNPILSKLSFTIKPREKIGVIGRTGSGKSTLIKLLWRALDFYEGDIKIDGKSIKEVDLKSLRSQIMIVTQETALIEGTLRENIDIRLEDKSRDAEITAILTKLGFANPNYLKDGLDMAIDGEGSNLSAGEKQLISFARTLLDKKQIMILDEATANIDLKTEEKIQACVDQDFKDTTMLIIAHRIQTIMNCDRILILEKGKMAALDTPANLSNQKDSYFNNIINKMKEKKN